MKKRSRLLLLAAATVVVSSCVDNNYKLSDLDTTVGVAVKNLTLPLNVDSLVLDQVLELEENSKIKKETVNGKEIYVIVEEGTFKSKAIDIPGFTTEKPEIEPITAVLTREQKAKIRKRGIERDGEASIGYPISNDPTAFTASGSVDKSIKGIDKIKVDANYGVVIDVADKNLMDKVDAVRFEGFCAKMPKGLDAHFMLGDTDITDCYNPETGELDLNNKDIKVEDGKLALNVDIDAIDLAVAGDEILFEDNKFELNTEMSVTRGDVVVYGDEMKTGIGLNELPGAIDYVCTPELSEIEVREFSGTIQYDIEDININPISLSDIPDMLSQDSTNIKLANPQIYLRLNNPLAGSHIFAEAGLQMTAKRDDGYSKVVALGSDRLRMLSPNNVYCLTANKDMTQEEMHPDYKDAEVKEFIGFTDILSGTGANGLPKEIEVEVVEPQIPTQTISDFELDQAIEPVEGTYLFYAPLALKDESSFIIYQDTLDGWYDETLEKLTIEEAVVNADVNSEIPLNLELSFSLIDVNGRIISNVKSNVVKIAASDEMQNIKVTLTGDIKGLDGMIIRAKVIGKDGEVIAPSQVINFKNLKIAVTGEYVDEF